MTVGNLMSTQSLVMSLSGCESLDVSACNWG